MNGKPARTAAIVAVVVLVPLFVLLATQIGADRPSSAPKLGGPVPAFDLPLLDGGRLSSADLIGTTYLVNFWNDWCVPCQQEHPSLMQFHAAHRDDPNVRLIGIVRDENSIADIREYVAREGVEWTVLLDPDGAAKVDFGTTGQPETFAVGPDGIVRGVFIGPASYAELEALAEKAAAS
jgi:cytochrome c biogenesis protein CcmG/thiol:disulfide interchange protein DsbE